MSICGHIVDYLFYILAIAAAKESSNKGYERRMSHSAPVVNPFLVFHPPNPILRSQRTYSTARSGSSIAGLGLVCPTWVDGSTGASSRSLAPMENDYVDTGSGSVSNFKERQLGCVGNILHQKFFTPKILFF